MNSAKAQNNQAEKAELLFLNTSLKAALAAGAVSSDREAALSRKINLLKGDDPMKKIITAGIAVAVAATALFAAAIIKDRR